MENLAEHFPRVLAETTPIQMPPAMLAGGALLTYVTKKGPTPNDEAQVLGEGPLKGKNLIP